MRSIVRGLYKVLLTQANKMTKAEMMLSVRKPLDQVRDLGLCTC